MAKSLGRTKAAQGGWQEVRRLYDNDPDSTQDLKIYPTFDDVDPQTVSAWRYTIQYESTQNTSLFWRAGYLNLNGTFYTLGTDSYTGWRGVSQDTSGGNIAYNANFYENSNNAYCGVNIQADAYDQVRGEIMIYGSSTINNTPYGGNFTVITQTSANDYISFSGQFIVTSTFNRYVNHGVDFSPYVNVNSLNDLQWKIEVCRGEGDY